MTIVLSIALVALLLLMIFRRRHLGALMQLASLLAGVLLLIWLQDNGYFGGSRPGFDERGASSRAVR